MKIITSESFPKFVTDFWVKFQTLERLSYWDEKEILQILRQISVGEGDFTEVEFEVFELVFYFCVFAVPDRIIRHPKYSTFKTEAFYSQIKNLIKTGAKIRTGKKRLSEIVANQTMSGLIAKLED